MNPFRDRGVRLAVLACLIAWSAASAKTKLTQSTRHPGPETGPAKKVLVIAMTKDADARGQIEDVIAGEIALRGAAAKASHLEFPTLPKDRAVLEKAVVDGGYDAVLVSRLVDVKDKIEWKEGGTSFDADYLGMSFWGGYTFVMEAVAVPGYLEKETRVELRSDLWRTSDQGGFMQWSGWSETLDPMNLIRGARQVGVAVATGLSKAKLI